MALTLIDLAGLQGVCAANANGHLFREVEYAAANDVKERGTI